MESDPRWEENRRESDGKSEDGVNTYYCSNIL
jgi:hypothetical protein